MAPETEEHDMSETRETHTTDTAKKPRHRKQPRTTLRKRLKAAGLLPATAVLHGPDLQLRLLHARFMDATRGLQDFNDSDHDMGTGTPEDLAFEATNETWWALMQEAINIRATSPEGLRVKAEMARWALIMVVGNSRDGLDEYTEEPTLLAFAALGDVLAMVETLPEGKAA
jgi:hypothetical protein